MPHFLVAISLTIAVVLTEPSIKANERIRKLGKERFGESLKEFQVRYPKAICGSAASAKTKPTNLTNPEITAKVYCYLEDQDSLARISPSPLLDLGVRSLSAIFWKSRLINLGFDLNVGSIRPVLDFFEKIYGPPTLIAMDDPADATKLTYVSWIEGATKLQVRMAQSRGEVGQKDSTHPKGQSGVETVCVALWNGGLVLWTRNSTHDSGQKRTCLFAATFEVVSSSLERLAPPKVPNRNTGSSPPRTLSSGHIVWPTLTVRNYSD
jgi:hypothetical protein